MDKIAQKRYLSKLREMTNISGARAEEFFSPQFKDVMDKLREIDDNVRSIISGQAIDQGDPGPDPYSAKKLLQDAKMFLNRREYMRAVTSLGEFHKHLAEVVQQINQLDDKVNEVHHQFLFPDEDKDHRQLLRSLKERLAAEQAQLRKEASISDFLHNLINPRGKAMAFYEKRYPRQVAQLKRDATTLLAKSEALLSQILAQLKEMAAARATRNVDKYVSAAGKIKKGYESYHKLFQTFYNDNVKQYENFFMKSPEAAPDSGEVPTVKTPGATEEEIPFDLTQEKAPDTEESPQTKVLVPSSPGSAPPSPIAQTIPAQPLAPHGPGEPFGTAPSFTPGVLTPPRLPTNIGPYGTPGAWQRDTTPAPPPEGMSERPPAEERVTLPPMLAHRQFLTTLESLSGEGPSMLAAFIRKYARSIQNSDPKASAQLFKVAGRIRS